jgi:hypothetical protein
MLLQKRFFLLVASIIIYHLSSLLVNIKTTTAAATFYIPTKVSTTLILTSKTYRQFVPGKPSHRIHQNRYLTLIKMASVTSTENITASNGSSSISSDEKNRGIAHLLARANILELQPYRCARDDYSTGILLDANENSYGPPSSIQEHMIQQYSSSLSSSTTTPMELERYPDPYQIPLKERLIEFRGYNNNNNNSDNNHDHTGRTGHTKITPNHIFVGVGSDEAIDLLMRIFCTPQTDSILTTPPTYGMYKVCAKVNDVSIVTVPLTPQFDVEIDMVWNFLLLVVHWRSMRW